MAICFFAASTTFHRWQHSMPAWRYCFAAQYPVLLHFIFSCSFSTFNALIRLGIRKSIGSVYMVRCCHGYPSGASCRCFCMVQLMPLHPIISCFINIHNGASLHRLIWKNRLLYECFIAFSCSTDVWFRE